MMGNPLDDMIEDSLEGRLAQRMPIPKYTVAVKITGNSREDVASAIRRLDTDWAIEWGERDEIDSTDGTTSVLMRHTNPEQTPEKYTDELMAWRERRREGSGGIS